MITEQERLDIIEAYTNDLTPMITLASTYKVTRQRIWQMLKDAGVDTGKRKLTVTCTQCCKPMQRTKARIRRTTHHFCSIECYYAWLESNSISKGAWRQGLRIARHVVSKHFTLQPGYVVHHIDGDNHNNDILNLMVFACNGDHTRYHRGFDAIPLFNGTLHNKHFTE